MNAAWMRSLTRREAAQKIFDEYEKPLMLKSILEHHRDGRTCVRFEYLSRIARDWLDAQKYKVEAINNGPFKWRVCWDAPTDRDPG